MFAAENDQETVFSNFGFFSSHLVCFMKVYKLAHADNSRENILKFITTFNEKLLFQIEKQRRHYFSMTALDVFMKRLVSV